MPAPHTPSPLFALSPFPLLFLSWLALYVGLARGIRRHTFAIRNPLQRLVRRTLLNYSSYGCPLIYACLVGMAQIHRCAPRLDGQHHDTVRYHMVRYGTVRYGTIWYGTIRYGTVRYTTVRHGTTRYDRWSWKREIASCRCGGRPKRRSLTSFARAGSRTVEARAGPAMRRVNSEGWGKPGQGGAR